MLSKTTIKWIMLCVLATCPLGLADCPTLKMPPPWDEFAEPYWKVDSQADAEVLKNCSILTGDLIITGSKASSPLIIDGPKRIKGKLMVTFPVQLHQGVNLFSMTTLESIEGKAFISQSTLIDQSSSSNLTALQFPALKSVSGWFDIRGLPEVHTINLPCLERSTTLNVIVMQSLHTLHVPKLRLFSQLRLHFLPSLRTLSFDAGLSVMPFYWGSFFGIGSTALESISGVHFTKIARIAVGLNKNLTSITFPFLTEMADKVVPGDDWGLSDVSIRDNGKDFHLDFPLLERIQGPLSLSGVRTIHIPELRHIREDLILGAHSDMLESCPQCSTELTTFNAPKLTTICGSLRIGSNPYLTDIKLPSLEALGGDIRINNTAVVSLQEGIEMPKLRQVHSVQIIGEEPYCDGFDRMHSQGVIKDRYWCGLTEKWTEEELRMKIFYDMKAVNGSDKDNCKMVDAGFQIKVMDAGLGLNMVNVRFLVEVACILVAIIIVWYIRRRSRG